ncbi:acyltransferase-domain-containing protein [Parasitella parasitica]|nr:acyltransferase-domain-containing protein [Parasitella parasitica]
MATGTVYSKSSTWWSPKTIMQILFVNFGLFFQSICCVLGQLSSIFIYPISFKVYRQIIAYTMHTWSQNLVALVQWFAPANVIMTFDESCGLIEDVVQRDINTGNVQGLIFPNRIIVTANHQIYADWIYIWCIAYLAKAHGALKIILKSSLKNLPVYGQGMRFFDFIFLKRKLDVDKDNIISNLERSKKGNQSLWLVLFPEGTVVSPSTRKRSKEFAESNDMQDNRYTLLPRSAGLRLCATTLADSIDYIYDFTIGYSGVEADDIPEQVYTIQSIFFFNFYPKKIHIYVRRFRVDSIPVESEVEFNQWNLERWKEKDELLDHFYKNQVFSHTLSDRIINVPIKLNSSWLNLAQIWIFIVPYLLILKNIFLFNNTSA